nr:MAG TPA: hypothetical protein [Caudoviricetes sp.]
MAKYKVGDKVRIVSEMPCDSDFALDMRRFLGKEITISMAKEWDGVPRYYSEDAKPMSLIAEGLFAVLGVPGYYFRENWISGLAEPEREYTVELRFDGAITTATLKRGGRDVKTAEARCNPKDTYSRAEGARVAVERLFEKKRKEDKPKESKPKIGDKFVVVGDLSGHEFPIGDIVTLCRVCNSWRLYMNQYGRKRWVYDFDVKPYKENAK